MVQEDHGLTSQHLAEIGPVKRIGLHCCYGKQVACLMIVLFFFLSRGIKKTFNNIQVCARNVKPHGLWQRPCRRNSTVKRSPARNAHLPSGVASRRVRIALRRIGKICATQGRHHNPAQSARAMRRAGPGGTRFGSATRTRDNRPEETARALRLARVWKSGLYSRRRPFRFYAQPPASVWLPAQDGRGENR